MVKIKQKWHHKDVLYGMYVDQELTMRQIAQILGTTPATIKYWMKKFNIVSRDFSIGEMSKGIKRTKEEKKRLSDAAKKRLQAPEDHPMYGRRHTEASRRKMSQTKRKRAAERRARRLTKRS